MKLFKGEVLIINRVWQILRLANELRMPGVTTNIDSRNPVVSNKSDDLRTNLKQD